jgi:hypothetical protein
MNPYVDNSSNQSSLSLLALSTLVLAVTAAKIQAAAEAQAAGGLLNDRAKTIRRCARFSELQQL